MKNLTLLVFYLFPSWYSTGTGILLDKKARFSSELKISVIEK